MKKFLAKKRDKSKKQIPTRITNETVAEHRERILAGGRRFKYPMQYARHRLVINTIIVTVVAVVLLVAFGWWQLYFAQNTSDFFYRVTRILPVPVASVQGEQIRYSDYLMYFNSSAHYLQQSEQLNLSSEDGKRQVDFIKRKSMDTVIADAYARKLARERGITIEDSRVDEVISNDRNTANGRISQETYDASALNILGWSPDEYRHDAKSKLIRQEVAYAIDDNAKRRQEEAAQKLKDEKDFAKIAQAMGGEGKAKVTVGSSGLVPRTNRDGGLSEAAVKLKKGEVSAAIRTTTGDGYYFVRLLESSGSQISYEYLRVPLTEFDTRLAALKNDGSVKEYISIPKIDNSQTNQ